MTEKTLKYVLPLTTSTGRARIKRRKNEFGEPLKQEDKFKDVDYIEWQISYFMPFDTLWEKFRKVKSNAQKKKALIEEYFSDFKDKNLVDDLIKFFQENTTIARKDFKDGLKKIFNKHNQVLIVKAHKDNKTYVMYELADLFEKALREKIISKNDITELLKFNSENVDIERDCPVTRGSLNKSISEDFKCFEEKAPLFIKKINDKYFTEIQIKHKQKAVGYQGMIYFCIWLKSFKDNDGNSLIGRKAKPNETITIELTKDDLFDIAKSFIITSKDHDWDVKKILSELVK